MLFNSEWRNEATKMRDRSTYPISKNVSRPEASRLGLAPRGSSPDLLHAEIFGARSRFTPPFTTRNCSIFYEVSRFANGATALQSSWGSTSGTDPRGYFCSPSRILFFVTRAYRTRFPIFHESTRYVFQGGFLSVLFARDAVEETAAD